MTNPESTTEAATWTWAYPFHFHRYRDPDGIPHDELSEALEQYTAYADGIKVGKYGEVTGGDVDLETWETVLRKRKEIDLCMAAMSEVGLRNLLHVYYRCGLSTHHRGWMQAAHITRVQGVKPLRCPGAAPETGKAIRCRLSGEPMDRDQCPIGGKCKELRETFDAQVKRAIGQLWKVHRKRYEGMGS